MSLREAIFSATRWTTASAFMRASTQLIQTVILARILIPSDFGLMAMAGVALSVGLLFSDLGIGSALMHRQVPDNATLSTLFWLNLGIASASALLFAAAGTALSIAYGQPAVVGIMHWLSLCFPLGALGQQFRVLAEKEMRFKTLAQNEVISASTGFVTAVFSAWIGLGVYALVTAQLVTISVNSLLAWLRLSSGYRPSPTFRWPLAKPFVAYGIHRLGDGFWSTLLMQADVFFAGLIASSHALGTYAMPREQSLKVANLLINPVITRVGLPAMTRLQNDLGSLRNVYSETLRLTASFNFPIYAFIAIFPEQCVSLLLGPQWLEAVPFLRIFAVWGFIRSTGNPSGSLLYAVGRAKRAHLWNLVLFVVSAPIFLAASTLGGLVALAHTMVLWQAVVFFVAWRYLIWPSCNLDFRTYTASLAPPLASTVIASSITYGISLASASEWRLTIGAITYGCSYILASCWLNKSWMVTLKKLMGPALSRVTLAGR